MNNTPSRLGEIKAAVERKISILDKFENELDNAKATDLWNTFGKVSKVLSSNLNLPNHLSVQIDL